MQLFSRPSAFAPILLAAACAGAAFAQTSSHPAVPAAPTPQSQSAEPAEPPAPAHPLTALQAHELMRLTGTDQIKTRLTEQILAYFQRVFPPYVPQDVRDDLKASLDKMDIDTPTVATYQRYISTTDATQIIAFYSTPAGKDLLKVEPILLAHVQHDALAQGQQTVQAVIARHKTEIEAAQKTYEDQHKAASPTLGPTPAPSTPSSTPHN